MLLFAVPVTSSLKDVAIVVPLAPKLPNSQLCLYVIGTVACTRRRTRARRYAVEVVRLQRPWVTHTGVNLGRASRHTAVVCCFCCHSSFMNEKLVDRLPPSAYERAHSLYASPLMCSFASGGLEAGGLFQ